MFEGRKLIVATKHAKESVIAPIMEKELGVQCIVDPSFDTDILGTFSGEVERVLDPLSTVRKKCLTAMQISGCDLGVASEGSFGPHPAMFVVNADDELLIFIDKLHNLEIIVREVSTSTNYNGQTIRDEQELLQFAHQAGFPAHGLILRKSKGDNLDIRKGIRQKESLVQAFHELQSKYSTVYVETDMRAMYNPSRMEVIKVAATKLVQKIKSACPQCLQPGFGITEAKKGLECRLCGAPTNSTKSYLYVCLHCQFAKEELYPHAKSSEDPMYCDFCNP